MYYVYVLHSTKDGKRYIGFTEDLRRRISEHNACLVNSTKYRHPLELVYSEQFSDKKSAMDREKFFKTHPGRDFLDSIGK